MIHKLQVPRLLAAAVVAIALTACASQQEPAQKALSELEASLGKVAEQGEKYMPEELTEVRGILDGLKSSYDSGDYKAVIAGAPKAAQAIRKLQADSIIAKANYAKQMTEEWGQLATTMPDMIASIDKQITRYTSRRSTPKGMSGDAFKETVASFDAAKKTWAEAAEAGNAGKYEDAVTKSRQVKQTVDTVMQALGMAAG